MSALAPITVILLIAAAVPCVSAEAPKSGPSSGTSSETSTETRTGLRPGQVPWSRLELLASRFPFSARSTVDLSIVPAAGVSLRQTTEGKAITPGAEIVQLGYQADLFGQSFRTKLWMQPETAAALQYETVDSGRRQRHRVLRFTERGVALWTVRPAAGEEGKPLSGWTDRSEGFRPYEPLVLGPVVDPLGLLYVVAAADLTGTGLDLVGLAGRELVGVKLLPKPLVTVSADYLARDGKSEKRCKGKFRAWPVEIRPEPLANGDADLDFLGLSSDIEVLVGEKSHLPLLITGRARRLGNVTIRLRSADVRPGTPCG